MKVVEGKKAFTGPLKDLAVQQIVQLVETQ